jgi:dipeptidyl aminopeptidase/acylaminoacyl peptidase
VTSPRDEEDGSPTWSPDSSRIAFVRGDISGKLWVVNADGNRQRRLAPSQRLVSPQWAPSGESIAAAQYYSYRDGDLPYHPGIRLVSPANGKETRIAPALHATVEIRDALTGRLVERFTGGGHARAIALGADYVALLAEHSALRVDLYTRNGSLRAAAVVPSDVDTISADGRSVVFTTRRVIRRVDARTGRVSTLASAQGRLVGATVDDHRVVWAENSGRKARIKAATAP